MNQLFNYYAADIKRAKPLGTVKLGYLLNAIRSPKNDIRHIFDQIKTAEESGDMAKKNALKTRLYSFTPCALVKSRRTYNDIQQFTGLMVLDFDHLDSGDAVEFKEYLFYEYTYIYAAWLSPSRHGVRAIVNIPVVKSVEEFKDYFNGIESELGVYNGFDTAPKNCILPMFLSYDPDILVREAPDLFNKKVKIIQSVPIKQYVLHEKFETIQKIIEKRIDRIVGNGHPQLRAASYLLGGYCSAGYIDYNTALDMIEYMIDSNAYLSQKSKVYKTTAKQMINKGMEEPVYLNHQNATKKKRPV